MVEKIPLIKKEIDIGTLGFYEYRRSLNCPIGGLSESKVLENGSLPEGFPTKKQIIGNIYHEIIDNLYKYSNKSDFIKFSQELIAKYEEKYAGFLKEKKLGSIKGWSSVTNSVRHVLNRISSSSIETNANGQDRLISTPDGLFKGVPDKLIIDGNSAYLTEYKSTDIFLNGEINEEYIEQIKFYSHIIFSKFQEVGIVLYKIQSMNGSTKEGELTPEDLLEYSVNIVNRYNKIKEKLRSDPTSFDINYCRFCRKAIICNDYRLNNLKQEFNDPAYLISDELKSIDRGESYSKLKFRTIDVNIQNELLNGYSFNLDTEYTVYRLNKRGSSFNWTKNTVVYEH